MYTEFYDRIGTGNDAFAGSTDSDTAFASDTGGAWTFSGSSGTYTASAGTPFASVTVGMWAAIFTGTGPTAFIGRVTAATGSMLTIATGTSGFAGTPPANGTVNCNVGGAWRTAQQPLTLLAATAVDSSGHIFRCNFKAGTYTLAAVLTRSIAGPGVFDSYTATPGDGGRAIFDFGGTVAGAAPMLLSSGANNTYRNMTFQNPSIAGSGNFGVDISGNANVLHRITVSGTGQHGFMIEANGSIVIECEAINCNRNGFSGKAGFFVNFVASHIVRCISHDHVGVNGNGFLFAGSLSQTVRNCIADTCGGIGFVCQTNNIGTFDRCDAHNCTGGGFVFSGTGGTFYLESTNAVNNGVAGISVTGTGLMVLSRSCGFYNNNGDGSAGTSATNGSALLTVDSQVLYPSNPYTNVTVATPGTTGRAGNFTPTLPQGKNAGRGTFTQDATIYSVATSTSFPDIGSVQHQEVVGGGTFDILGGGLISE